MSSNIEMTSKKKKKGPGSKRADMDVEISKTSVSRKERIAAAKLPPGMSGASLASPRGSDGSNNNQRRSSIATLGGAATVPASVGASGSRRMSTLGSPVAADKSTKGGKSKDRGAHSSKEEGSTNEERARQAERKRSGKAFLDELIKTSTLTRNNEDAIIETSKKTFSNFDDEIRKKNLTMAILGSVVMFLVVVTLEYPWDEEKAYYDRSLASMHAVEVLCSVITAYLMYLVYDYYNLQVDLDRLKYRQKYRTPLWKTAFFFPFMLELIICFLHPVPWSNQRKMGMLAFMKLYLWIRVYRDYSAVYRWRQDAIDACDVSHGIPQFTSWLSVRTLFYKWPWYFVSVSVAVSLVLLSFMIYVVERETLNESCLADPCNCPSTAGAHICLNGFSRMITAAEIDPLRSCCHSPFKKLAVCLYYTAVTMTTVGYGDYATLSSWGRGISMWAAITGVCLSALLVTALLSEFSLTFSQKFAADFVLIKQLTISERDLAARCIQLWFRRLSVNKGHYREGESRGLSLRMSSAQDEGQRSHLPSAWTHVPGSGCFGETYDEALMWAIKAFRQHRMLKEQTLTMDSEGGNGLYKTIVQVTRAYELMTQKVIDVELSQRRMQIVLRKLVLLFARLPQSLDPTSLLPLGLGASMIEQLNKRDGGSYGGSSNNSLSDSNFVRSDSGLGAGSDSERDSIGGSASSNQMNAEAQKRLQQLEQQLVAKNNQIQKMQQAESTLQRSIEDLNKKLMNSQDRTQKVIEVARKATSVQGPLRYRVLPTVIKGLESVAVGGKMRNGVSDEDLSQSDHGTSLNSSAMNVELEESKLTSVAGPSRTTQSPAISRTSIVMPTTIANAIGGNPGSILAIRTEAPTAEDLADPDGEWEEVVVPEDVLQEVAVVPVRPTLAPGVTRMSFGARNVGANGSALGMDNDDDDEEDIDGSIYYPNMSTSQGPNDRFY